MIGAIFNNFIDNALNIFKSDDRFTGVAAAGSYITKDMDKYSDIDLVIAVEKDAYDMVMSERIDIAQRLGVLLAVFTGEHVGEPRLIICLYDNPLLHVDLKFVSIDDIGHRVEDFIVLWERNRQLTERFSKEEAKFPTPDLQWIEDRFWVWIHYGAAKIGRGEIFETIEFISFLRQSVIGPLILMHKGKQPKGVRKIEFDAPEYLERLKLTVAAYEREACYQAIKVIIALYKELRELHSYEGFIINSKAEQAAVDYLEGIMLTNERS